MSLVVRGKGAAYGLPHKHFAETAETGLSVFNDMVSATPEGFTTTSSPALTSVRADGTALLLDAADEIEFANAYFTPADGVAFAGSSRVKIKFGADDVTAQNIMFATDSTADPTEKLGFQLATSGANAAGTFTVVCKIDDGTTDDSVTVAAADLPGGASFDPQVYHTYGVAYEPDSSGGGDAAFYVDGVLVAKVRLASTANWNTAGLVWIQTNLTASSTHDQAIDWISLGSERVPV